MCRKNKHRERSHRSYRQKDAAFRNFSMKAYSSKTQKTQRKTFAEQLAGLLAMMHRSQNK